MFNSENNFNFKTMPSAKEILKSLKRTNPSIWNDWRREKKNVPEELEKINFS